MEISELIGYLASFLVAISFTVKAIEKLRIINSLGAVAFVAYGIMIDSIPVILTNLFIVSFNIYHLFKSKN